MLNYLQTHAIHGTTFYKSSKKKNLHYLVRELMMSILFRFFIINENNKNKKSLKDLVCLCSLVFATMEELSKAILFSFSFFIKKVKQYLKHHKCLYNLYNIRPIFI